MKKGKAFLVNVSIRDLPFPVRIASPIKEGGQDTIANISIQARIMKEFEAGWIDKFIQVTHNHRDNIGVESMRKNIREYLDTLNANTIRIEMAFPYFVEKRTPKSDEPCLVKYNCSFSAHYPSIDSDVKTIFTIDCPVVTSYPLEESASSRKDYFPQMSVLHIEVQPKNNIVPEDIVQLADDKCLVPIYSFLTSEDQKYLIEKTKTNYQTSIDAVDEIRAVLARDENIQWYSISSSNYGMLHNYSTIINLEKSYWVPGSHYEDADI